MQSRSSAAHRAHAAFDARDAHAATDAEQVARALALKLSHGSAKRGGSTVGVGGFEGSVEADGWGLADAGALADADDDALADTVTDALAVLDGSASAVSCDSSTAQRMSVQRILYVIRR